jgi:hypothetical protein
MVTGFIGVGASRVVAYAISRALFLMHEAVFSLKTVPVEAMLSPSSEK